MDKKWTIGLGLLGILIVFLLLWNFAPAIQRWLAERLRGHHSPAGRLRGRDGSSGPFRRQTPPQRRRTQRTQHHPSSKKVTTSMKKLILLIALALPALLTAQQRDWPTTAAMPKPMRSSRPRPPVVSWATRSPTEGQRPSLNLHGEQFRLPAESAGRSPARCSAASGPT